MMESNHRKCQARIESPVVSVHESTTRTTNKENNAPSDSRSLFIAKLTDASTMGDISQRTRPRVLGVHHLKFAVSNLDVSLAWYERVVGAKRVPNLDHIRKDGSRFAA